VKPALAHGLRGPAAAALAAGLVLAESAAVADESPPQRPPEFARATAEPASIRVQGDTIYYTGNLSKASSVVFDAAVAGVGRGQLTRLVVSSGGGDTVEGRHVGRWVRDRALVVEVDVICFSSCADYVFPAGRARVIRADAFVGWHGTERQFDVRAARTGVSVADQLATVPPADVAPGPRAAFVQEALRSFAVTQKDEAEFYASLGHNDAFAVCAVGDVLEKRPDYAGQIGWAFSLADMARLGLAHTVYLGDGRYERDSARLRQYLLAITADDCLALLK